MSVPILWEPFTRFLLFIRRILLMKFGILTRLMEDFIQKETTHKLIFSLLQKRRRGGLMFTVTKISISISLELLISILLNKKQRPILL